MLQKLGSIHDITDAAATATKIELENVYVSIYLYLSTKHIITITYSGQDSETTTVPNTALNTQNMTRK